MTIDQANGLSDQVLLRYNAKRIGDAAILPPDNPRTWNVRYEINGGQFMAMFAYEDSNQFKEELDKQVRQNH